ncbi:hypothetical protein SMATCC274_38470 [Serratia marcescens]|nr:hypothetical protein SMATCC274_38470 [Serratia marcescens]
MQQPQRGIEPQELYGIHHGGRQRQGEVRGHAIPFGHHPNQQDDGRNTEKQGHKILRVIIFMGREM